jgi:hypothetical protein
MMGADGHVMCSSYSRIGRLLEPSGQPSQWSERVVITSLTAALCSSIALVVRVAFLRSESPRAGIDGAFADYADADLILLARWRG